VTSFQHVSAGWAPVVRGLFIVAAALFVITVAIGIVNGLDLYEFDHNQLLTHVHSGTLGWITLGLVAGAFWLVRRADRRLAIALAVLIPIYVAAFYSGDLTARAITGTLLLIAILWLVGWAWLALSRDPTIPFLAVTLGLTSFAYGAVIGVLLQIQFASGRSLFPGGGDAIGAHAGTMVFSYLILVAMGLLEWRIVGLRRRSRGGLVQIFALFGGGLLLALTLLFLDSSAVQVVGGIYLLVELIAVALFVGRVVRWAVRVDWRAASPERYLSTSAVFVVIATAIFLYVVFLFISTGDPAKIPAGVLVASDHAAFVGVITNLIFGLALRLAADRRARWAWADQVVYWAMNGGLVVFLLGLIAVSPELKRIGAPIMGTAILLGLVVIAGRLWTSDLSTAEEMDAISSA
jgi:hypothetical protein